MQLIKQSQANKIQATQSTLFYEYFANDKTMGGALITINGRYPDHGFALNQICKELAYIIKGTGTLATENSIANFTEGDSLFIPPNEKFVWEGSFTMYVVTTPAFDPKQHILVQ